MKTLFDIPINGQRVLLRTDFDVPLKGSKVADATRIKTSLPTIRKLLQLNAKSIEILCHLDRPQGKIVESLRIKPIAVLLKSLLPEDSPVSVEENLRFNPGEEDNDFQFAKNLSKKSDVFINDAFAVSHRNHASIVTLPKLLPSCIGLHFEKEIKSLDKVLRNPKRPLIFIIGGAKLETKLPLIEKLTKIADELLIGGKLAQEISKLYLPQDIARIQIAKLEKDKKDISLSSAQEFSQKISQAGTVVWNGPLGVYEETEHSQGTRIIAQAVNKAPGYTVIGGGDTEAAATKFHAEDKLDHISMGGGAMLEYIATGTLPGIEAIKKSKYKK